MTSIMLANQSAAFTVLLLANQRTVLPSSLSANQSGVFTPQRLANHNAVFPILFYSRPGRVHGLFVSDVHDKVGIVLFPDIRTLEQIDK